MILAGQRVSLACSVGVATWPGGAPRIDADTLMQRAADALVDARIAGGGRVVTAAAPRVAAPAERETA
jgi:predicted signal transduction protein with EAL and GGDEF domain